MLKDILILLLQLQGKLLDYLFKTILLILVVVKKIELKLSQVNHVASNLKGQPELVSEGQLRWRRIG